ncbi:hypothetical protein EDB19DRAFT_885280 [Suillus lakei]|nr:hypothetical protein EDB19DRAFT_885280 [Suillus lakei]
MSSSTYSSDFTPADCAYFNICGPASTPIPIPTDDRCQFYECGMTLTIIFLILFSPCYIIILWIALYSMFRAVCSVLRAVGSALFGRALNPQLDLIEDDRVHEGGRNLLPLVLCGTWLRPPSPIEEAASMSQSERSSAQPVSVSLGSQVAFDMLLELACPDL